MAPALATASTAAPAKASVDQRLEIPVVQGWQAGSYYWMTNVSIAELARYFQPFFEREQASKKQPLSLAQRTLNLPRVKKVAQYILKGCMPHSFYVLPPATVTVSIPETESFDFWGVDFEDEDQSLDSLPSPTEIGTLALPPNARFWLADGQHRIAGAIQAYREGAALLGQETIGLMLIPDADGAKEKQIFLDINKHAVKPNQSILALFDGSDTYCEIARSVLIGVPVFEGRNRPRRDECQGRRPLDHEQPERVLKTPVQGAGGRFDCDGYPVLAGSSRAPSRLENPRDQGRRNA
jgi:DGQHR domain-containing protein